MPPPQVSECSAVIIPVLTQRYALLQRNLLYTGITRGKRLVVLVGRRRLSRSRFATYRAGDGGRSSTNGFGSARPPNCRTRRRGLIEAQIGAACSDSRWRPDEAGLHGQSLSGDLGVGRRLNGSG